MKNRWRTAAPWRHPNKSVSGRRIFIARTDAMLPSVPVLEILEGKISGGKNRWCPFLNLFFVLLCEIVGIFSRFWLFFWCEIVGNFLKQNLHGTIQSARNWEHDAFLMMEMQYILHWWSHQPKTSSVSSWFWDYTTSGIFLLFFANGVFARFTSVYFV